MVKNNILFNYYWPTQLHSLFNSVTYLTIHFGSQLCVTFWPRCLCCHTRSLPSLAYINSSRKVSTYSFSLADLHGIRPHLLCHLSLSWLCCPLSLNAMALNMEVNRSPSDACPSPVVKQDQPIRGILMPLIF